MDHHLITVDEFLNAFCIDLAPAQKSETFVSAEFIEVELDFPAKPVFSMDTDTICICMFISLVQIIQITAVQIRPFRFVIRQ